LICGRWTDIPALALDDAPIDQWIRSRTDGLGVDVLLDCSGRGSNVAHTAELLGALKRGGVGVTVGALTDPLPVDAMRFMTSRLQFRGCNWFSTGEAQQMAEMVGVGALDFSKITTEAYPLAGVNDALEALKVRPGGFVNIVVHPDA
jgi:alcohol dehydrogenase